MRMIAQRANNQMNNRAVCRGVTPTLQDFFQILEGVLSFDPPRQISQISYLSPLMVVSGKEIRLF